MRWSKIKNIILLILTVVNLCLLSMVGLQMRDARRQEEETRTRMLAVLTRSGVTVSSGAGNGPDGTEFPPGPMPLTGKKVHRDRPGEREAALLLDGITDVVETEKETVYIGPRGSATFSGGGRGEVRFGAGALPLNGADAGAYGTAILEELGIQVREWQTGSERVSRRVYGTDGLEVSFVQLWDGQPVPQLNFRLTVEQGELRGLTGQWLSGAEEPVPGPVGSGTGTGIDGVTALARFLELRSREGYVCSEILRMYPGYTLDQGTAVTLRPTWFLETDTWPWCFAVDAWTGEAVPWN